MGTTKPVVAVTLCPPVQVASRLIPGQWAMRSWVALRIEAQGVARDTRTPVLLVSRDVSRVASLHENVAAERRLI